MKLLVQACSDYQDILYLPGDKLSSTGGERHSLNVKHGTEPINNRSCRLSETQKMEIDKQVKNF